MPVWIIFSGADHRDLRPYRAEKLRSRGILAAVVPDFQYIRVDYCLAVLCKNLALRLFFRVPRKHHASISILQSQH